MSTVKAVIVRPDGVMSYGDIDASLDNLQSIVGGYIEGIGGPNFFAYCNEEGKLKGLPINPIATEVAGFTHDILCGPVVFFGPTDDEGNETDVPADVFTAVMKAGGR